MQYHGVVTAGFPTTYNILRIRQNAVYVSELGQAGYRLETTSGSGRVFSYAYDGGVGALRAGGGGYESGW